MTIQERNEKIKKLRQDDKLTLREIGDAFKISRQRVLQILVSMDVISNKCPTCGKKIGRDRLDDISDSLIQEE